ncbi:MAG: A/G-specific adenine glycosylase, partial [Halobacteriaceae archaeon]
DALANADQAAVLEFWTNHRLGYNNRAKYLYEAANQIVREYEGQIPKTPDELENLKGVGPYTANAVASFAFNNGNAVVDTNVKRILYRIVDIESSEDIDYNRLADLLFPEGKSRVWNNAIMELGGVVCQKTPRCDEEPCPWREWCQAYHTGDFTAPDVPDQPSFEGSRRQIRGRIIRILANHEEMT